GRRKGLKIPRGASPMSVRLRLPALENSSRRFAWHDREESRSSSLLPLRTLCDIFTRLENECRKLDLLRYKSKAGWTDISAADFVSTVRGLALGFQALGIEPGERVALLSENRPEWVAFDHALLNL